jgi:hypothetical protein
MTDDRWERLVEYCRRARSMPAFDAEERDYRLEIAQELRRMMELAVQGGPWRERFETMHRSSLFGRSRKYDLTERRHRSWVKRLRSPEALGLAMERFLDPSADPLERFTSFVRAAEDQQPELKLPAEQLAGPDPDREAVLSLGALLNFACAPEELPAMRPGLWNLLEQTLGYEWTFRRSVIEQYELHLEFTEHVQRRLREAGVELRDMLDTQSLIYNAGLHPDFWAPARTRKPGSKPYLSICAIYRDEARYLAEWVEFHRLVGVERFFLYNNLSEDDHREVLAPYIDEGLVTVRDWPVTDGGQGQLPAYNDALRWHRYDSRWIAFIDLDEFLFSPGGESLPEVLSEYEEWPGVAVRWAMFGTSGHKTEPPGLVTENYLQRIDHDSHINMKTVVDPTRASTCVTAHHFRYPYLSAVDENHFPVNGTRTASNSIARLRLNHYHWKSEEHFIAKTRRFRAIGRHRELPTDEHFEWLRQMEQDGVTDRTILMYAPALREALVQRASATVG